MRTGLPPGPERDHINFVVRQRRSKKLRSCEGFLGYVWDVGGEHRPQGQPVALLDSSLPDGVVDSNGESLAMTRATYDRLVSRCSGNIEMTQWVKIMVARPGQHQADCPEVHEGPAPVRHSAMAILADAQVIAGHVMNDVERALGTAFVHPAEAHRMRQVRADIEEHRRLLNEAEIALDAALLLYGEHLADCGGCFSGRLAEDLG